MPKLSNDQGNGAVVHQVRRRYPWLECVFADAGYGAANW